MDTVGVGEDWTVPLEEVSTKLGLWGGVMHWKEMRKDNAIKTLHRNIIQLVSLDYQTKIEKLKVIRV